MNNQILLSICIPTYNRAEYLNQTIQSIVNSNGFGNQVEIVISDNCSTDNTESICNQWTNKYQNIKYFRQSQPTHIADQNFIDALTFATGQYLKLNNDTVLFRKETIKYMLNNIKDAIKTKNPLFFYINYLNNKNSISICYDLNSFVKKTSYFVTWLSHFGCWKEHFDNLSQKNKAIKIKLMQTDWSFRLVSKYKKTIICFSDLYDSVILQNKSGGYNILEIFSLNYLSIFKEYMNNCLINKKTYSLEKKKLLFRFLMPSYIMSIYQHNTHKFSIDKPLVYLKEYWHDWYFYLSFLLIIPYFIICGFIFIVKKTTSHNLKLYNFLRKIKARIGI